MFLTLERNATEITENTEKEIEFVLKRIHYCDDRLMRDFRIRVLADHADFHGLKRTIIRLSLICANPFHQ